MKTENFKVHLIKYEKCALTTSLCRFSNLIFCIFLPFLNKSLIFLPNENNMYNNRTQRVSEWDDETKKTKQKMKEKNIKRWGKTLMIHLFVCIYTYVLHFFSFLYYCTRKERISYKLIVLVREISSMKYIRQQIWNCNNNILLSLGSYSFICARYLSNLIYVCGWIFILYRVSRYGFWFL